MELRSRKVKAELKSRDRKRRKKVPSFPDEIVIEILSRLPVNSLLRFQSVSKHWCSTIKDGWFISEHYQRANPVTYLYEPEGEGKGNNNFALEYYTSDLILEKKTTSKRFRVRNPFTRQLLDLPIPHRTYTSYKTILAKIPNPVCFKAFHISEDKFGTVHFEVLTIGIDERWRPLKHPNPPELKGIWIFTRCLAVHCVWFLNGGCARIESLDFDNECFYISTLPPQGLFSDWNEVSVIDWRGQDCGCSLAFVDIDFVNEVLNAVVLEDYKKQKWSDGKVVVPLTFLKEKPDMKKEKNLVPSYAQYEHTQNDQLWFGWKYEFVYHIKSGRLERLDDRDPANNCLDMKESLVTLKGMQSVHKLKVN